MIKNLVIGVVVGVLALGVAYYTGYSSWGS